VAYDDIIEKILIHDRSVLNTAFRLRRILSNFIDCIILSSATNHADILVTEDDDLQRLEPNREYEETLKIENPHFKIQRMAHLPDLQ
jgi:hypothetical protein